MNIKASKKQLQVEDAQSLRVKETYVCLQSYSCLCIVHVIYLF